MVAQSVAVPFACTMPSPAAVNVIPLRVAGRVGSTHLFPHTLTGMVFTMLPAVMVMEVSPSLRARTLAPPLKRCCCWHDIAPYCCLTDARLTSLMDAVYSCDAASGRIVTLRFLLSPTRRVMLSMGLPESSVT